MTDKKDVTLEATVPQDWIDKLEKLAKQTGYSVNALVRESLAKYLEIDSTSSGVFSQLEQFQSEIKLLKQKVSEVELYKNQIKDLSIRLAGIEQGIGKMQSQSISSSQTAVSEEWFIESQDDEIEDDFEDEPDEILSDFIT